MKKEQLEGKLSNAERQKKLLQQRSTELQEQLDSLESNRARMDKLKRDLEDQLTEAQMNTKDRELVEEIEGHIKVLEGEIDDHRKTLNKEKRCAYKSRK